VYGDDFDQNAFKRVDGILQNCNSLIGTPYMFSIPTDTFLYMNHCALHSSSPASLTDDAGVLNTGNSLNEHDFSLPL
jgi:hypothetical protein